MTSDEKPASSTTEDTPPLRDARGRFAGGPGGGRYRGGRKPGALNVVTREVKEAILKAYKRRGGIKWLAQLDDEIFARLLARLIPTDIKHELGDELVLYVRDYAGVRRPMGTLLAAGDDPPAPVIDVGAVVEKVEPGSPDDRAPGPIRDGRGRPLRYADGRSPDQWAVEVIE